MIINKAIITFASEFYFVMTEEQELLITSLKEKINKIITLYDRAKEAHSKLEIENTRLRTCLTEKEIKFKDLEEKYSKLKLVKAVEASSADLHDAKLKINRIVREVDKCIALLNR